MTGDQARIRHWRVFELLTGDADYAKPSTIVVHTRAYAS